MKVLYVRIDDDLHAAIVGLSKRIDWSITRTTSELLSRAIGRQVPNLDQAIADVAAEIRERRGRK